eukprot:gene6718-13612_t
MNTMEITETAPPKKYDELWLKHYQILRILGEQKGECNLPVRSLVRIPELDMEVNLGNWLREQRRSYKQGSLTPYRKQLLQVLVDQGKLQWTASKFKTPRDNQEWDTMFAILESGRVGIDAITEKQLNSWMTAQRALRKLKRLLPEREAKLSELVLAGKASWHVGRDRTDDQHWDECFQLLLQYGACHIRDCNVPTDHIVTAREVWNDSTSTTSLVPLPKPIRLGKWLARQRQLRRDGTLREDRRIRLQELVNSERLLWHTGRGSHNVPWELPVACGKRNRRTGSDDDDDEDRDDNSDEESSSRSSGDSSSASASEEEEAEEDNEEEVADLEHRNDNNTGNDDNDNDRGHQWQQRLAEVEKVTLFMLHTFRAFRNLFFHMTIAVKSITEFHPLLDIYNICARKVKTVADFATTTKIRLQPSGAGIFGQHVFFTWNNKRRCILMLNSKTTVNTEAYWDMRFTQMRTQLLLTLPNMYTRMALPRFSKQQHVFFTWNNKRRCILMLNSKTTVNTEAYCWDMRFTQMHTQLQLTLPNMYTRMELPIFPKQP